ncbi:MAG: phosphoethanolamine transferase domain-containing protein [Steroidobacteraceae bacterium]
MRASGLGYQISHTGFSIAFPIFLYVICNALIIDRLSHWFQRGDGLDYAALGAYLVAGVCLFIVVFTLLAHRTIIKPVAILLVLASAAATYFIRKYGVAIDSSMVQNTIHTDTTEVTQLLSFNMVPYILFLVILPVTFVVLVRISFRPGARYLLDSLKLSVVALCLALACLGVEYNAIMRVGNTSNKYIVYMLVPINVISGSFSAASKAIRPYFKKSEASVVVDARVTEPGNLVVVLAVGESSRRKNFSAYGYAGNPTNPELAKIDGLHLLDGTATRASTLYALPKILTKDDIKLATVVSKAGIPTECLVNYTLYENCAAVGEVKPADCGHGGQCFDEDVIPLLEKSLGTYRSGYRFVVLHLGGGSHGPNYNERVPAEFRQFKPTCDDADVAAKCSLEQLYNSYDNTILYVDHVLGKSIDALERSKVPYVFIYLSDHGESLMEHGVMFHGVPPGMALPEGQAQIPLIVKSSVPVSIAKRAEYGQPDVFDSVLDLLSIQSTKFDKAGSFLKVEREALTQATPVSPAP